jgi:hypothetical protein
MSPGTSYTDEYGNYWSIDSPPEISASFTYTPLYIEVLKLRKENKELKKKLKIITKIIKGKWKIK